MNSTTLPFTVQVPEEVLFSFSLQAFSERLRTLTCEPAVTDTTDFLKDHLHTLRQTVRYLLEKAAAAGGEVRLDPKDRHSLDQARTDITQYVAELRGRGVVVDDEPEDTAAGGNGPASSARALLDRLSLDQIPPVQTLPRPHRMPLAPNPLFVGRDDDFRALAALLKAGTAAVITTGIGGMGKTQLAAEVAHRYGAYFAGGVFWISCADPAGVAAEVAPCGRLMGLALDGKDQDTQLHLTRAEWETDLPRLLILDNCEEETTLRAWKPTSGACRVLVTSRRAQWSATLQAQARPLGLLSLPESVALLRKQYLQAE